MMLQALQDLIYKGKGDFLTLMTIKYKMQRDIPVTDDESYYFMNLLG